MKNEADILKAIVLCYWRFEKQHYLVGCELSYGQVDVISVSKRKRIVCETEIKISISDLKADKRKPKHCTDLWGKPSFRGYFVDYFYFALPENLIDKARPICDELYPYAGILSISPYDDWLSHGRGSYISPPIKCVKKPSPVGARTLSEENRDDIIRAMSNSYCRLAFRFAQQLRQRQEADNEAL